ncbi:MAG TPA: choice-of-anchor D domain-containing protein [Terriglobales bacterium]|nr:choice-of-anchor D domain-containing protein [Terriglobales bacterium]
MRSNYLKTLKTAVLAVTVLLLGVGVTVAQQVNLTAGFSTTTLPDGSVVPMWGYSCGAITAGSSVASVSVLTPGAGYAAGDTVTFAGGGSGATATITVDPVTGAITGITLANGGTNYVAPTTVTITSVAGSGATFAVTLSTAVSATCSGLNGQPQPAGIWAPPLITVPAGSGLSIQLMNALSFPVGSTTPSSTIPTSLVIVGQLGGGLGDVGQRTVTPSPVHGTQDTTWPIAVAGPQNVPPPQPDRVQSFSTEVAVGTPTTLTWSNLRPGTYLIESGTHPSIQGPMGLYGVLVVTTAPTSTAAGTAYPAAGISPAVTYNAEIPLLLSEIDPVQNNAVNTAVNTAGFSETMVWSGQPGGCGNPSSPVGVVNTCYPPAVNYKPLYYLINGVAFNNKGSATSASASLFAPLTSTAPTPLTGSVLVRMVNAGLRMHVPSIVGSLTTPAVVPTGTTAAAVPGFSLVAEDGNRLPGVSRVQSEVFMAAGKTYDVMIDVPAAGGTALPVFDRQLSLSGNATGRDEGMLAYLGINNAGLPAAATAAFAAVQANPDTYNSVIAGQTLTVSDPGKGVLANDVNVYGAQVMGTAPAGLTFNADGTFTYTAGTPTTFTYCGNGATTGPACALVTLGPAPIESGSGITCPNSAFTSTVATALSIKPPGILAGCKDALGYPLTVNAASITGTLTPATSGTGTVTVDPNGGFNASVSGAGTYTFSFKAQNSQGTPSATAATVTLSFPTATGLKVNVVDGKDKTTAVTDYRWIIEEDRTFYINPACTTNPPPAGCPTSASGIVPTFGTNFHTSYMPVVAAGCTGSLSCEGGQTLLGQPAVCDGGNGICRPDTTGNGQAPLDPGQVHLDPTKHYYISVLPGDAANSFENLNGCLSNSTPSCGHGMGGAPIACVPVAPAVVCTATSGAFPANVNVLVQPNPFPPSKLSVFVFEDDFPLNGEQDGGGGIDVLSPNEPGLGGFNIILFDDAGGTGDATGQMTYDMFNMPLSNGLAGTIDPSTGLDVCPISGANQNLGFDGTASPTGITGTIVTCPKYEADGATLSPLAGQAVVANLMPGRYGVVATPAADRIARGEEWLQTNTLDGQKAHDSFLRIGEPSFFQEFGPAGYHVSIGFANPQIINNRKQFVCNGTDPNISGVNCTNSITGTVTTLRMSRTPDQRLYSSGDNTSFSFTQCYVSFGDADGEDFAFTKCDANGNFTLSGLPDGDWRITVFDQWNDMLVDGLSTPVRLAGGATVKLGQIATNQWQTNIYTKSFLDLNGNGLQDANEPGLALVSTNIRFRDGSYSNFNNTDLQGNAGFNEVFPLFSWYVVEGYSTRYKNTATHVVYDAGGPGDTPYPVNSLGVQQPCPTGQRCTNIAGSLASTNEQIPVPAALRVPGAFYCPDADCSTAPIPLAPGGAGGSTGRIDPPLWFGTEGWQGFSGQNSFLEFGKKPYVAGETGGIFGEVIYASTRPFDDPTLLIHTSWTPDVPGVTVNLYKEGTAPDGSQSLTLIDTTKTSSFDDWAQGFRSDGMPNMNCPGQGTASGTNADLFFFSLYNQPDWLDEYNNGGTPAHTLPNNSQFKCYDGMHNWNQLQPVPYDGMYSFPSVTAIDPTTGKPAGTNCTGCTANPDATDPYRFGTPMLPAGKYVVEMIVPPGYELVKEEDKNILIGDNYIAPVTQQFAGLGNIFILPDQAEVSASANCTPTLTYACNPQQSTQSLGRPASSLPQGEGDTGSVETFWPCVGASRVVPDFISLFPQSAEVAPFAGATRNLCDRKEVTLQDQSAALAKFWIFSSTHVAAHFTGVITDDFTSEFDPFSPQFGEKFSPPDLPISIKDWSGTEIARTYADHWGAYNGLTYSTWEVNPPNPTGYAPTMMVTCMNDPGTGPTPDPLFNPQYSQFCYEIPFMPGQTQYMDTPVVPTSAFAGAGYNNPDCNYPANTPAIKEVDGDGVGPWLNASGALTLTITALGDQTVPNNAYSGPSATTAPFNQKTITRHYGFGARPSTCGNGANCPNVTIGGVSAVVTTWTDTTIVATARAVGQIPLCAVQQQAQYGGSQARCGQLVITAANGLQSVDTVTVTIGGKAPTHVPASGSIQAAIDAAKPGDLIIIDPTCPAACTTDVVTTTTVGGVTTTTYSNSQAAHQELLLMWKPVRLQGVGAASSVINANAHPAGKVQTWRNQVDCLFGLGTDGSPNTWQPSCAGSNWFGFVAVDATTPQVDRLPLEATVGWDANLNGNLAELLQEPSLMGALEGAGITVLAKGVDFHGANPFDPTLLAGFPPGTTLLTSGTCGTNAGPNPFPSSFQCNPSSIDGLSITDSSQGGGGIFVHGWGHNIQIANNRIYNNAGTLSGGLNVGQGEFPPSYVGPGNGNAVPPGSCQSTSVTNLQLPYCHNLNVNVHNNYITQNASTGDELFSATPAGAGGVSFCTGSDFYKFQNNWVCGNLSTGDGGGIGHLGFSYGGDIEHNSILFNQSTNPTIATNGGGLLVMGTPDVDPTCGATTDTDCVPALGSVGPSDGVGPGLVINANLIMGNAAESGSGGGLRLQHLNGTDVLSFPNGNSTVAFPGITGTSSPWYSATVTNNIIVNNVAGWDGGGVSLLDALNVNVINNTIESNDSTASAGVLFNTIGAPLASTQQANCIQPGSTTASCPQVAGLVSVQNSATLVANFPASITCPAGHGVGGTGTGGLVNGACRKASYPVLYNDVFWQNRSFYIGVGPLGTGTLNQQNTVALYIAGTTTQAPSQATTGACPAGASYWDIGVRGDTGPGNHASTVTLSPEASILTSIAGYPGGGTGFRVNSASNPAVVSQYCNGSRVPPEFGGLGYQVPPGISDATVPNPIFNLTPVATVDEGNNWINISWGPLAETNPVTNATLGNYALTAASPAINYITPANSATTYAAAPSLDFFNNSRKTNNAVDVGAVEFAAAAAAAVASVTPTSLAFGNVVVNTTSASQNLTLHNTGTATLNTIAVGFTGPYSRITTGGFPAGAPNCGPTLAAGANCTIKVVFSPTAVGSAPGTASITGSVTVGGSPVTLTGTGVAAVVSASLTPASHAYPAQTRSATPCGTADLGCPFAPIQVFTLTNTGNVTLTGIMQGVLGGTNPVDFNVDRLLSTCGPAGGGQLLGQTTLAPGASCVVTVAFHPRTSDTTGAKSATVSVTDAAGTQTSTLTGTAN